MINLYLLLSFEFFKIGLFTFGGGYGSLPFLFEISQNYSWFSNEELTQMIAISGLTPGPIGLNMATFAGFKTLGVMGALISSASLVVPMLLITTQVFRLYDKFCNNSYVQKILYVLRPTSCALIGAVGLKLFYKLVLLNDLSLKSLDLEALFVVVVLFLASFKFKKNPIYYMLLASLIGIIFKYVM